MYKEIAQAFLAEDYETLEEIMYKVNANELYNGFRPIYNYTIQCTYISFFACMSTKKTPQIHVLAWAM